MDESLLRFWHDLVGRVGGPMSLRLILQPLTAVLLAVRAGRRDARTGRAPYLAVLFTGGTNKRTHLLDGWRDIGRVFVLAVIIDAVYQAIELGWFFPGEALVTATVLAIAPYVLIRGPVRRIALRWR